MKITHIDVFVIELQELLIMIFQILVELWILRRENKKKSGTEEKHGFTQ